MKKGNKRSAEEWLALVAEWESSKQSQPVFCQERGVTHSAFQYWRAKKAVTQRQSTEPELVELKVTKKPDLIRESSFRVTFPSGLAVEATPPFNSDTLAQLLNLVKTV